MLLVFTSGRLTLGLAYHFELAAVFRSLFTRMQETDAQTNGQMRRFIAYL